MPLLLIVLTSLTLLIFNWVQDGYGRGPAMPGYGNKPSHHSNVETIVAELNQQVALTTSQQAEVISILKDMEKQHKTLMQSSGKQGGGEAGQSLHQQMHQIHEEAFSKIGDFLNEEQLKALKEIMERSNPGGRGGSPPGKGFGYDNPNQSSF